MTRLNRLERRDPPPPPKVEKKPDGVTNLTSDGDVFEGPSFQGPAEVESISLKLSPKHSDRRMGSDPNTESNCSIYTFDVIKTAVEKDGGKLDSKFQLEWMNATSQSPKFDGVDKNGFGPAHALKSGGLGYMVANTNDANFDRESKKFMKGDFVQLQSHDGGHQGVLTNWGREEDGRAWLEIRGFQKNPDTGWIDVNVKRVHLHGSDGSGSGYDWERAVIARYDPNETYRARPSFSVQEPKKFLDNFDIAPISTSDLLGHLRLR